MTSARISIRDARKLALQSQRILNTRKTGKAQDETLNVIQHLGYIQIDTISVIERAHNHTLWSRNPRYKPDHLNKLIQQKKIFEYWSHAAAYLPIEDFRLCLPNMQSIASGRRLWFRCDKKVKKQVLQRIQNEGPLQSKDFENHGKTQLPMWEWKPAKYALEQLFMEGRLMVVRREKFQKVYDLTERVLPEAIDLSVPAKEELCQALIHRYINAHGFGDAAEIAYLRKGLKPEIQKQLNQLRESGELTLIEINKKDYFTKPSSLALLEQPLYRSRARILSPFDNLVIQRRRINHLFDFDYQIECYVPEAKRRFGYFCLPVLWNGDLVARMDCKADRKSAVLIVKTLYVEPSLRRLDDFCSALVQQLIAFMNFNGCTRIELGEISHPQLKACLGAKVESCI